MDGELAYVTLSFISTVIEGFFSLIVIAVAAPIAIAAVVPSLIFYYCLQRQYRASARELQVRMRLYCLASHGVGCKHTERHQPLAYM